MLYFYYGPILAPTETNMIVQRQIDSNRDSTMNLDILEHRLTTLIHSPLTPSLVAQLWDLDAWWMRNYADKRIGERRNTIEAAFTMAHIKRRESERRSA